MTKPILDRSRPDALGTLTGTLSIACGLVLLAQVTACSSSSPAPTDGGGGDSAAQADPGAIVVSTAVRRARTTTWSVNYWSWMPSYGGDTKGTETAMAALKPAVLRVGGYNNDANSTDAFDHAQLDEAVAYARAIGAEPLIQVPLLADIDGNPPTAASAAAMVTYANVTKGYGIKYFSIGNEPDLYATQGSLVDPAKPAIPNYQPSDYCASASAYVAAMKAVDPTITIVGPDLSWRYDWLTLMLQGCGQLFDIVSIHRYPFNSRHPTLDAAQSDATTFGNAIASVRARLQATGYGDKPLALTEMNVAYDVTPCQLDASPGTIGAALWLADGLGTAIVNDLWTSAVWDISDADNWSFGLLGSAPAHTPRPAYFAYQLYANHFGPTLVEVSQQPSGVRAYASRNQADNATEVVVVNWNRSSTPLSFHVTGLTSIGTPPTYTLPALSISAVEISDDGVATAWSYGDVQHRAGQGPALLSSGATASTDAGLPLLTYSCSAAESFSCPKILPSSPQITTLGTTTADGLAFGSPPYYWTSYTYGSNGQSAPTVAVMPDGKGIAMGGSFVPPVGQNWMGAGLRFGGASCLDGSHYTGVQFDFSGDLGGCTLAFGANFSGDSTPTDTPVRSSCPFNQSSLCYAPMMVVTPPSAPDAGEAGPTTLKVPFASMGGGSPTSGMDSSSLLAVQWQLNARGGGPGCTASFTVANVAFY